MLSYLEVIINSFMLLASNAKYAFVELEDAEVI